MSRSVCMGLAVLAVACGSDGEKPTTVMIDTEVPPALIAFRDETATDWQPVTGTSPTKFELRPTGPYRVLVVCELLPTRAGQIPSIQINMFGRTPDDGSSIDPVVGLPCSGELSHTVTGTMAVSGQVRLGPGGVTLPSQMPRFTLRTTPGLHDLVVTTGDTLNGFDWISIRRDVEVSSDIELGDVLADARSVALTTKTFTAQNRRENEGLQSSLTFRTPTTSVSLQSGRESGTWNIRLVPESVLRATDRQRVGLFAITSTNAGSPLIYTRAVSRDIDGGTPEAVTLPEPLGPVTFETTPDRLTATWSTLPPYKNLLLSRIEFGTRRQIIQRVFFTQSFTDAIAATSIELALESIPGFKPEWKLDPAVQQSILFGTNTGTTGPIETTNAQFTLRPLEPF